jgi:hypothetical protein
MRPQAEPHVKTKQRAQIAKSPDSAPVKQHDRESQNSPRDRGGERNYQRLAQTHEATHRRHKFNVTSAHSA